MLCQGDKFPQLIQAQSLQKQVYLWRAYHNIYKGPVTIQAAINFPWLDAQTLHQTWET